MYPTYTTSERIADGCIHAVGVSAAIVAFAVMLGSAPLHVAPYALGSMSVYGVTMVAMLGFSAAYNLMPIESWKGILRRCDQAAIFVKIAGTYTPFALAKVGGFWGFSLLATVWSIALLGAAVKLARGSGSEMLSLALYLGLGWIGLLFIGPLVAALPADALILLGLGGVAYTTGVLFHVWDGLPYQNAIWHLFVLAGTALHFAAVVVAMNNP